MFSKKLPLLMLAVSCTLSACGTAVPRISEAYEGPDGTRKMEFEIRRRIFCDLGKAVRDVNATYSVRTQKSPKSKIEERQFIPATWGAQVSLSLEADEATALNPGLSLNTPRANATSFFSGLAPVVTPQLFSLGIGGTISSTSSNVHKFDPYYPVSYLMVEPEDKSVCGSKFEDPFASSPQSSSLFVLNSDIGIKEWLDDSMYSSTLLPSQKAETVTYEVKFIVVTNGNLNPSWKLVRISSNIAGTPLLSDGRTRTHDLIITLGPKDSNSAGTHLASQIAQATGAANKNALTGQ